MNDNERIVSALCSLAKLDVEGVTREWQPVEETIKARQPLHVQQFLSTLQASNGIIKSGRKEGDFSVEKEAEKWAKEFEAEVGNRLKEVAEATMDDYEYLMQFRV